MIGEEVHEHVRNCYMDTDLVPLERSGNCLAALRMITAATDALPSCDPDAFFDPCDRGYGQELSEALLGYQISMTNSLWTHGTPTEELLQQFGAPSGYGHRAYRDLELVEKLFEHCLELEQGNEPASVQGASENHFHRILSVSPPVLGEGELCFREGYKGKSSEV